MKDAVRFHPVIPSSCTKRERMNGQTPGALSARLRANTIVHPQRVGAWFAAADFRDCSSNCEEHDLDPYRSGDDTTDCAALARHIRFSLVPRHSRSTQ
jgi:hypothetical protein